MIRWILCMLIASVSFTDNNKICLSLVVENNEIEIMSCLNNVQQLADCILIYDMGSTDETAAIAKQFLAETKIPGIIQRHDPKNDPRISAIECARKLIQDSHLPLENTYILSLEPNMTLQIQPSFYKSNLSDDIYLILEKTPYFSSYRPYLVRSHNVSNQTKAVPLKSLFIEKKEDPAQKFNQYSIVLHKEPDNAHTLFSMAQSRQASERYDEAIEYYQQTIAKKGDREETWFSQLMIGECYEKLGKWDEALSWYLESFQTNPRRAEPLKKITTHYRLQGWNELAYLFAKFGSLLPLPDDQIYFDLQPLQDYQFDEELSIVSYYTQFKEDGYAAASDLLLKKNVPSGSRWQAHQNILFYLEPLKEASFIPIEFKRPLLQYDKYWNPMNPSIRATDNGYEVICRTVNYVQKDAKEFHSFDENGFFRSRNFLLQYDNDFQLLSQREIIEDLSREKFGNSLVQGLEDCRIFEWMGSSWFSCTTTDTNPTGSFQISLCRINKDSPDNDAPVEFLLPLKGPDPNRCEKNWLPFVHQNSLHFIYSYDPLVIYEIDRHSGDCKKVRSIQPEYDFSSFRGSAGPISFNNGYLILVHEVAFLGESRRRYMHRFIFLDQNFKALQASKPFVFKKPGVEFCISMCWNATKEKIVLAVGIEDREAYFCIVNADIVDSLLRPLPKTQL